MILCKDEAAVIMVKGTTDDINELRNKENTKNSQLNNNTEKIGDEIKNNEIKTNEIRNTDVKNKQKNQNVNKTPIKNNKKSVTKDIKESTFSAYQDISTKFKKKYEYKKN